MYWTRAIAGIALLAVIAVGLWQATAKDAKPDSTTLILLFFAILLVVAFTLPSVALAAVNRISNLDVLGVKIEFQVQEARNVAKDFRVEDSDEVAVPPRPQAQEVNGEMELVANELKRKLRFTREAVLNDPRSLPETNVAAHLHYMKLLKQDEAELCQKLLGEELRKDLPTWDAAERSAFLDAAWRFSWRFATHIFDRYARRTMEDAGWFIADFEQSRKHRADFLACWDGNWARVSARVAAPRRTVESTAKRMSHSAGPLDAAPAIIVPDHVEHLWDDFGDGPKSLAGGAVRVLRVRRLLAEPDILFTPAPHREAESG